jgi:hypothetical protein
MAAEPAPRRIERGAECGQVAQGPTASLAQPSQATATDLDSQALTAFGAACIDHGAATFGLHANQEAVSAGAADFGGLVCTFHDDFFESDSEETLDYRKILAKDQTASSAEP